MSGVGRVLTSAGREGGGDRPVVGGSAAGYDRAINAGGDDSPVG